MNGGANAPWSKLILDTLMGVTPDVHEVISSPGVIAVDWAPIGGKAFYIDSVLIHLDAAPTSPGSLTIELGGTIDYLIAEYDMLAGGGVTDIMWINPGSKLFADAGDTIKVNYTNPDSRNVSMRISVTQLPS